MSEFENKILMDINNINSLLRDSKPGDRSERDRHFAICLTELEKFKALFIGLICKEEIINE